jgi:hypothetical protein
MAPKMPCSFPPESAALVREKLARQTVSLSIPRNPAVLFLELLSEGQGLG